MLSIHHCVMVVGSTSGGKSFIINTLIQLQCHLGLSAKRTVLNPKVNSYLIDAMFQGEQRKRGELQNATTVRG